MTLHRLHVDGFLQFHDYSLRFGEGVNVLHGPNEAGKSTLLWFIRYVLFGFQHHKRSDRAAPLAGGRLGGYLQFGPDDLRIERYDKDLRISYNGAPRGEVELEQLLGQFDQAAFDAVFACDLDGLREMGALDHDGLRRKLFASTVLGVGVDIDQVEKGWKERRRTLSKRGRHGVIYSLEQNLREARSRLASAQERSHALPGMLEELESLGQSIEDLRREHVRLGTQHDHLRAVIASREQLSLRAQLLEWLHEHPRPAHPSAVWQYRREQLRDARLELKTARDEEARLAARHGEAVQERDAIHVDEPVLELAPRIQSLTEQAAKLPDLGGAQDREREAQGGLESRLAVLGLESLQGVDLTRATQRRILDIAEDIPPPADVATLVRTEKRLEAVYEEATAAVEQCTPPGPALTLEHRLREIEHADERATDTQNERAGLEQELASLVSKRSALEAGWPCLPSLDPADAQSLLARVDTWWGPRRDRLATLSETRRAVARASHAVKELGVPLHVEKVPTSLVQWADQRKAMADTEARLKEAQAREEAARISLQRRLPELPLLSSVDEVRACAAIPWTQISLLVGRLQEAGAPQDVPDEQPRAGVDRGVLVEQQHQGIQLHGRRESARRWQFATRALLVLCALFAILGVVLWGFGTGASGLVLAGLMMLFWVVALGVELYLRSVVHRSSTELLELGAENREDWLAGLGRALAKADLQDDQLRSRGASEALEAERARDRQALAAHAQGVPTLVSADWGSLAELAVRMPQCLSSLDEMDRLGEDVTRLQRILDNWVGEGRSCASLGIQAPQTLREAYGAASAVDGAEERSRQQQVAEEARKRSLAEKRKELAGLRQREVELDTPIEQDGAIGSAVLQAGASDLPEERWNAWLQAGLEANRLAEAIEGLENRVRTLEARAEKDRQTVESALECASAEDIAALRQIVRDAVQARDVLTAKRNHLDEARRELNTHRRQVELAQEEAARRARGVSELDSAVGAAGWPAEKPQGVPALIERLRGAQEALRDHQGAAAALVSANAQWDAWRKAIGELAGELDSAPPEPDASLSWLRAVQVRAQEARDADVERRGLLRQLEQTKREYAAASDRVRFAETALADVQDASDVPTEEEALRRFEEARSWESRHDQLEELERILRAKLGDVDLDVLEHQNLPALEENASQLSLDSEATQADLDALVERKGVLARDVDVLEASADVVDAAAQVGILEERLKQAQLELAELQLALTWLKEEYERYVQENQPAVLKRASALLKQASDGTMDGVVQDNNRLYVRAPDGTPREPKELSRGSREMLFLVIRLALALEHAERTRVPLLLDDVMVNQDPERAQQIARVIELVGREHQVILLTCRPEMRDLMVQVDPDANVLELKRFGGRSTPVGTALVVEAPGESDHQDDVMDRVVAYLSHDWERRSAIMEGADLSPAEWAHFRSLAHEHPSIEHNGGQRRGSAYRLASSSS